MAKDLGGTTFQEALATTLADMGGTSSAPITTRTASMPMSFFDNIPSAEAPHRSALWQSLDDALACLEASPGDRDGLAEGIRTGHESPESPPPSLH